MKFTVLILLCLTMMACSQKSDVIGVKSGDDYYALDHAAKDAVVNNDEESKLICRRTQVTGSHFKTKKCTTKAQLEKDRKNAQDLRDTNALENARNRVPIDG